MYTLAFFFFFFSSYHPSCTMTRTAVVHHAIMKCHGLGPDAQKSECIMVHHDVPAEVRGAKTWGKALVGSSKPRPAHTPTLGFFPKQSFPDRPAQSRVARFARGN
jgi:hypothetical protein